ncbi:MAG TPA: FAD-dependent oxidoreductase, partial [Vicinamibacterales bacterium]|nr:FAD-dependent oxidoreductase [Vicinamibacterales bacterium]
MLISNRQSTINNQQGINNQRSTLNNAVTPHIVIIGGGFGGLSAARALRNADVRVTLIDRRNHHVFQPLLYQVATATLSPG